MAQAPVSDGIFSSPFDSCFENGYHVDDLTSEQAFSTAQCFTALLDSDVPAMELGASKHTIQEYSLSWYMAAADKGHALALSKLSKNLIALNQLEQTLHSRVTDTQWQMLASDPAFKALDANGDGVLSKSETSSNSDLQNAFAQSDFDNDGVLSIGEYAVNYGEATAAGNR